MPLPQWNGFQKQALLTRTRDDPRLNSTDAAPPRKTRQRSSQGAAVRGDLANQLVATARARLGEERVDMRLHRRA